MCPDVVTYICWVSDCINGIYFRGFGFEIPARMFGQSVIWLCAALLTFASAVWILSTVRPLRFFDVLVSFGNCTLLLIGLVPDVLPGKWMYAHAVIAFAGTGCGLLGILGLPRALKVAALLMYGFWYVVISEWLVVSGVPAPQVWTWRGFSKSDSFTGQLSRIILEWTLILGACTVCLMYSLSEDCRRQHWLKESDDAAGNLEAGKPRQESLLS